MKHISGNYTSMIIILVPIVVLGSTSFMFIFQNESVCKTALMSNRSNVLSDISETHHTFIHNSKQALFFIPASNNEYFFTYRNRHFSLVRTIKYLHAKHAICFNDYLCFIGTNGVTVIDDNSWVTSFQYLFSNSTVKTPIRISPKPYTQHADV